MKLSIIIPVYNEEKTIMSLLERVSRVVLSKVEIEVIVVDDGSTDGTAWEIIQSKPIMRQAGFKDSHFKKITHEKNRGKGAAVITGIQHATGDYIIIQDADLEYNPQDIATLLRGLKDKKVDVVYGTRLKRLPHFKGEERTLRFLIQYVGNKFLSLLTSILYGQWVTDMETCYKLFPKSAIEHMKLRARGFEFEPEITAKLIKEGYKIVEIPIITKPRGVSEGKKLNAIHDGYRAVVTLIKYRFID